MFILDKDVVAGRATLEGCRAYAGKKWTYNIPSSNKNASYVVPSGTISGYEDGDRPCAFYCTDGASVIRWHRLSDGTLVMSEDMGLRMPLDWSYSQQNSLSNDPGFDDEYGIYVTDAESTGGISVGGMSAGAPIFSIAGDSTIGGAKYKTRVMRIGYTSAEQQRAEYNKYMVSTGVNNWRAQGATVAIAEYRVAGFSNITYYGSCPRIENGAINTGSVRRKSLLALRLVATPSGTCPALTPAETDLGIITEPTSVTIQMTGTPTVSAKLDGDQTVQVSTATGNFTVDLSTVWSDASYGDHEIICVAEQNGYKTGARIRFTKSASAVMVTTAPHSSVNRPSSCRLVGNLVVPTGAILTQEVTNNGNDAEPTWEVYTGDEHFFSNATKTASQWGLAARVSIDNNHGNAVAEIKDSLAMGVLYEGGAE